MESVWMDVSDQFGLWLLAFLPWPKSRLAEINEDQ
jgi:hypothetical protein